MNICETMRRALTADLATLYTLKAEIEEYRDVLFDAYYSVVEDEESAHDALVLLRASDNASETLGKLIFEHNLTLNEPADIPVAYSYRTGITYRIKITDHAINDFSQAYTCHRYTVQAYYEGDTDEGTIMFSEASNTSLEIVINMAIELIYRRVREWEVFCK